jgi:hypothetical protein
MTVRKVLGYIRIGDGRLSGFSLGRKRMSLTVRARNPEIIQVLDGARSAQAAPSENIMKEMLSHAPVG